MNKWFKVSGTVAMIAAAGVLTVSTMAFAQETDATPGNDDTSSFVQRGIRNLRGGLERLGLDDDATSEEVQAAKIAKVQEKVADGSITQEEADEMIARIESGERVGGKRGHRGSRMSLESLGLDENATQEEIQAAMIAHVQSKVADGTMTQEEADAKIEKIESGEKSFGKRGHRGSRLSLESLGLDENATQAEIQAAMIAQVQSKVADGTITQEQADQMIERIESGERGRNGRGNRGARGGNQGGNQGDNAPAQQNSPGLNAEGNQDA